MQKKKFFIALKANYFQLKISIREPTEPAIELATEQTPKPAVEATPTKDMNSKIKLQQEFMDEIIADKKDNYNKIFKNSFKY